jgi:WD40 repeat protein/DNA-binding SARP family transcriptional activator/energy-coupling factor transporter ATP-binding protein EcfA2
MTTPYKIHLLGPVQIEKEGQLIEQTGSRKGLAVLGYLVDQDRPVPRTLLAHLFWPDKAEARGRRNLSRELSQLAEYVPGCITGDYHTVVFQPGDAYWLDTWAFADWVQAGLTQKMSLTAPDLLETAGVSATSGVFVPDKVAAAVALYRDDFMSGLYLSGCPDFESWLVRKQEQWRQQITTILDRLIVHYTLAGDDERTQCFARRWLELEPWHETAHRHLMLLLNRNGQRSTALAQFEQCRRALAAELGIEPSPETVALVEQIKTGTLADEVLPASGAPEALPPCPYRGLTAFTEADAPYFFGRKTFVDQLMAAVEHQPLVAVVGPSGSGKSSVVFAGLLPRLRRDEGGRMKDESNTSPFVIISLRPGSEPLQALAAALAPLPEADINETEQQTAISNLQLNLETGGALLPDVAAQILTLHPGGARLLLVIDQFEEIYTLCREPDARQRFLELLLQPAANNHLLTTVITLRADFMGQALAYRPLADVLQESSLMLGPMTRQELRRVVEKPAEIQGVTLEPALVESLLDDVGHEPGNLPLLEFTLTLLWEDQTVTNRTLSYEAYQRIGCVQGALLHYADQVYADLAAAEQTQARRIFVQLVQPGRGTEDTRRVATRVELGRENWPLVQQLANTRLIVTGQNIGGQETAEIVHEALIREWPRLQGWLNEDRAFRIWQERLRVAMAQWAETGQDENALLRGTLLAEAEEQVTTRSAELNPLEVEFIKNSVAHRDKMLQAAETQRQRELTQARTLAETETRAGRRLRWLGLGLVILLAVAISAAVWAIQQQQQAQNARNQARRSAEIAHSLRLATGAQLALNENNTDLALALALEANRIDDPPAQARSILAEAAYAPGTMRVFAGHTGPVASIAFSPNGQLALSGSADHSLILWHIATGEIVHRLAGHAGPVTGAAFSPDGETIISVSADQQLIVWDAQSGAIRNQFQEDSGSLTSLALSPDGQVAVYGTENGDLLVREIESGRLLHQFGSEDGGHREAVQDIAVSADGRRLLTNGADSLILWDISTGHDMDETKTRQLWLVEPEDTSVHGVAFSPDGQTILLAQSDGYINVLDVETGESMQQALTRGGSLSSIAVSDDGRLAVLGHYGGTLSLWDVTRGEVIQDYIGHVGQVLSVAMSGDGRYVLSGGQDGLMRLRDLQNGALIRLQHLAVGAPNIDVNPQDGRQVLSGFEDGTLQLWDAASGAPQLSLEGHTDMIWGGVEFSPDGRTALSGAGNVFVGSSDDNTLRLWDTETGQEIHRLQGHTRPIYGLDMGPDGQMAVSVSQDGTTRTWDLAQGHELGQFTLVEKLRPRSVAFSPDGRTIAVGTGTRESDPDTVKATVRLLDVKTGDEIRHFDGEGGGVTTVAFSPDGQQILAGFNTGLIILWDVETGQVIHRLEEHQSVVTTIVYAADGKRAMSSSGDASVIVWDLEDGAAIRRYVGLESPIEDIAFGVNEETALATSWQDKTIWVWRLDATQESLLDWIETNRHVSEFSCKQRIQYQIEPLCDEAE